MSASDFHQIKTSIIKSVRPSFVSSYEWKLPKSKRTLFSVLKILALHLYAKLTSDESKFLWKPVMPQVAKQLHITQKIYSQRQTCARHYTYFRQCSCENLGASPNTVTSAAHRVEEERGQQGRAGQGRRDRECTNTQHFTNDYWPVYMHIPSLPNAVTSILCLSIHGGVPVTVIENNGVCTCQIDANTAWPCRKDEAEDALVSIEAIHQCL